MPTFNLRIRLLDSDGEPINPGEVAAALVHGRGRVISSSQDHVAGYAHVEFDGIAAELSDPRVVGIRENAS